MSREPGSIKVLGIDIMFKPGTDMERAEAAARLLAERFADQQAKSQGPRSRDVILAFTALGLADELLQLENSRNEIRKRLHSLLAKIEKSL